MSNPDRLIIDALRQALLDIGNSLEDDTLYPDIHLIVDTALKVADGELPASAMAEIDHSNIPEAE